VFKLETPLTDRYEAIKTADFVGEKIPIGVIYRNDEARCREVKEIFRVPLTRRTRSPASTCAA